MPNGLRVDSNSRGRIRVAIGVEGFSGPECQGDHSEERMNESDPIGYLCDGKWVLCLHCGDNLAEAGIEYSAQPVKLYHVNVYPYRQTCHNCGGCMCEGQSEAWCELFPKADTEYAEDMRW